jgi:hypothetical protein
MMFMLISHRNLEGVLPVPGPEYSPARNQHVSPFRIAGRQGQRVESAVSHGNIHSKDN